MKKTNADLAVFIGRMQPYHIAHHTIVQHAMESARYTVVLLGSCGEPRNTYNPFTFEERRDMILASLDIEAQNRILFLPLYDLVYNDNAWVMDVQSAVNSAVEHFELKMPIITLIGHSKDSSSYYLKLFPQFKSIDVKQEFEIAATTIRHDYFDRGFIDEQLLPKGSVEFLKAFIHSEAYKNIQEEYNFVLRYREPYRNLPYRPVFNTVDACVVQSGHILLVKRRAMPGRGLWALPGGFLNSGERIEDAVYRELYEETKIDVRINTLKNKTVLRKVFDAVHRSSRGRTITHAFLIDLGVGTLLPQIKGSDDALKAKWIPLADVKRNQMFEDHFSIISNLTAKL